MQTLSYFTAEVLCPGSQCCPSDWRHWSPIGWSQAEYDTPAQYCYTISKLTSQYHYLSSYNLIIWSHHRRMPELYIKNTFHGFNSNFLAQMLSQYWHPNTTDMFVRQSMLPDLREILVAFPTDIAVVAHATLTQLVTALHCFQWVCWPTGKNVNFYGNKTN